MPVNTNTGQLQQATSNPFTSFLNGLSTAGSQFGTAFTGQPSVTAQQGIQQAFTPNVGNQTPFYLQQPQVAQNASVNTVSPNGVLQTTNNGVTAPFSVAGITSTGFNQQPTTANGFLSLPQTGGVNAVSQVPPSGAVGSSFVNQAPVGGGVQGLADGVFTDMSAFQTGASQQPSTGFLGLSQDTLGTLGTLGGLASDFGQLYFGFQGLSQARDQFNFQRDAFNRQYNDQLANTQREIDERNQRRQNAGQ